MSYRLVTYKDGADLRAGIVVGEAVYDAARASGTAAYATVQGALDDWSKAHRAFGDAAARIAAGKSKAKGTPLKRVKLAAPLPLPGDIYCAGANYRDHVAEMDRAAGREPGPTIKEQGEKPWHFVKTGRASVVGPGVKVKIPPFTQALDWEIELAAVVGRVARNVPAAKALAYVAGYTIANDLSARDAGRRAKMPQSSPFHWDWVGQKCFDGSCPLGPWIVPAAEIKNPHKLGLKLWVGEELMQNSNTDQLIFDIGEQIGELSKHVTLYPGDVILTGTPAGVGAGRKRFLQPGEVCRLWIEGIGELVTPLV